MRRFTICFRKNNEQQPSDGTSDAVFTISCENHDDGVLTNMIIGDYKKVGENKFSNDKIYLVYDGHMVYNEETGEEIMPSYNIEFVDIEDSSCIISSSDVNGACIENIVIGGTTFTANDAMLTKYNIGIDDPWEFTLKLDLNSMKIVGTIESNVEYGPDGMNGKVVQSVCTVFYYRNDEILEYPVYYIIDEDNNITQNTLFYQMENGDYIFASNGPSLTYAYAYENYNNGLTPPFGEWTGYWNPLNEGEYIRITNNESKEDRGTVLTVSGCIDGSGNYNVNQSTQMNGNYYLIDTSASGNDRIWKHELYEYYIVYYFGMGAWMITDSPDSTYHSIIDGDSSGNPYNSDGSSCTWYYGHSIASNIKITATNF
jgi:hypothetical protein